ncbi:MAG: dihydroorotate dehydrogenase-like protein, partial [Kiritimatiellae bacterium]|nr:dihydroorotate dehydrogenase-like protein [Kiritimatiellia bacterium]
AGADVVYLWSALYSPQGFGVIGEMLSGTEKWMTAHGFDRLSQFRGKLREQNVHDGHGFERAHYMNILGNAWQAHGHR